MRILDETINEIRDRLPVSQVVGRTVMLKKAGREYRGLSPFKGEKTPSFFVNDGKQMWHDFSSNQGGDIFAFLMLTQGLSFREAAERLAREAGVAIPEDAPRSPAQQERADRISRLYAVCAAAQAYFRGQFAASAGDEARAYCERRGISREAVSTFGIGYAPAARQSLRRHLAGAGFSDAEMIEAGLIIGGDDIPTPYDRFRDRVMIPIPDAKGRAIAFGGRALAPEAQAKYLNSSETPIFRKGRLLFNWSRARSAIHTKDRAVVVEGYMDVIGMAQGGIHETVATLGTALTVEHLQQLWSVQREPTILFDGDSAGEKAGWRAIELALPLLAHDKTLRIATMPAGLDPDDMMLNDGREALEATLAAAKPVCDALWDAELSRANLATPETRAALEHRVMELVGRIQDTSVRYQYRTEMRRRLNALFQPLRIISNGAARPARPRLATNASPLERLSAARQTPSQASAALVNHLAAAAKAFPRREMWLISALVAHPELVEHHGEIVARLPFAAEPLGKMRDAVLEAYSLGADIKEHLANTKMTDICEQALGFPIGATADIANRWLRAAEFHLSEAAA